MDNETLPAEQSEPAVVKFDGPMGRWFFSSKERVWARQPQSHEINGYDPLSGMIIASSTAERDRIDAAAIRT